MSPAMMDVLCPLNKIQNMLRVRGREALRGNIFVLLWMETYSILTEAPFDLAR